MFARLCLTVLLLAFAICVGVRDHTDDTDERVAIIEFGGSGGKVVGFESQGGGYLFPMSIGPESDGVVPLGSLSKASPTVTAPEATAEEIKKILSSKEFSKVGIFVSGGHIAKYANESCNPSDDGYNASACVPAEIQEVQLQLEKDLDKSVPIKTDEAMLEATSVLAGFNEHGGTNPEDVRPALVLLAGSTSTQFVYVDDSGEMHTSTFITQGATRALVQEKLANVTGSSDKININNVFICSNFAFALVQPKSPFLKIYTAGNEQIMNEALTEKGYKPNQATPLTLRDVQQAVQDVAKLGGYERQPEVFSVFQFILEKLTSDASESTFFMFKELKKDDTTMKVGAAHGEAMMLLAA
eukprot:gb/GFBE01065881.1/.p1 GENE.gb/GFBE01065881.1/~~gb/GFBE01065881.1/.p1  ORF type:complete len:356 (+),score=73.02 gb/GFBE01065881.1/:1-1068(+)